MGAVSLYLKGIFMKWVEINTQDEAYDLLENKLWRFHDGCFRELHLWDSYYISEHQMHSGDETMNAKMLFQGNWADGVSAVELYFSEVQHLNIVAARPGYWSDIYEATPKKADGIFYGQISKAGIYVIRKVTM